MTAFRIAPNDTADQARQRAPRVSDLDVWRRMKEEFRATDVRCELAWAGISDNDRVADRMMQRWRKLGWAAPSPSNKRVWVKF